MSASNSAPSDQAPGAAASAGKTNCTQQTGTAPQPLSAPRALAQAAGVSFLLLGFLGRLPAAFNQLGMLLIVAASGRGLAAAGATVAAVGIGTALGAPLVGRAVDHFGPVRVLLVALAGQVAALAGIMVALLIHGPTAALLVCAGLLGAANPQAGSIARACWSGIARQQTPAASLRTVRLGFGFETAADETSFVVGPVVAGLLVTALGPLGATAALMLCTVVFEGAFALWLARHPRVHTGSAGLAGGGGAADVTAPAAAPLRWRALAAPLLAVFATGMVFGATQTALTAINEAAGLAALTGPMYGAMGVTSALAGLVAPSLLWPWRSRLVLGGAVVAVCSLAIAALPGAPATLALILLMGFGIGCNLSTAYTELEAVAPAGRITSVMTIAATCLVLGLSAGSLAAGLLGSNLHLANAAAVLSGVCIVLAGILRLPDASPTTSAGLGRK